MGDVVQCRPLIAPGPWVSLLRLHSHQVSPDQLSSTPLCGDYRIFVVYENGTDMVFVDRLVPKDASFFAIAYDATTKSYHYEDHEP